MSSYRTLLVALLIDDFGSGLFLPVALLYATTVVGLPVGLAGVLIGAATALGLLVPPVAGHAADRFGPKRVVVVSQFVEAAGAVGYLLSHGPVGVFVSAALLAVGQRGFYSSVFTLVADVQSGGKQDSRFTTVAVWRAIGFGAGGLAGAATPDLHVAIAVDAASFVVCAAMLELFVRSTEVKLDEPTGGPLTPLADRRLLAIMVASMASSLGVDVFLVGMTTYIRQLGGPGWLFGVMLAVLTWTAPVTGLVMKLVGDRTRTNRLALALTGRTAWALLAAGAVLVPVWLLPVYLIATLAVMGSSAMIENGTSMPLVEAIAPADLRGRYLALFQYAFLAGQMLAPLVFALTTFATWLPWAVSAALTAAAVAIPLALGRRLPVGALR